MIKPCIPDDWPEFRIEGTLADGSASYRVHVENPEGFAKSIVTATLDGVPVEIIEGAARFPLPREGTTHEVRVVMG